MKIRIHLLAFLCFVSLSLAAQITTVGLIGPGSPVGDWDTDTDMTQDATNPDIWTITTTLKDGLIKFRANDGWDINWGNSNGDFPIGIGYQGEGDLTAYAGDYTVTFNSSTGEYYFDVDSDIGLIGPASPIGDWDTDWDMYKDQTDANKFFTIADLSANECKFRKDNDWAVNWGANTFPTGVAVLGDPGNIPVDKTTKYMVKLDTMSGEYSFEALEGYDQVGLIGMGAGGDWDTDIFLNPNANDFNLWSGVVTMAGGEYKFRANADWAVSWGGPGDFPTGTATQGSNDNLVAEAGDYLVNFNSETGDYNFEAIVEFQSIGIIGDGSPSGDWDTETPMIKDAVDPHMWTLRAELSDGELKFRANNAWDTSWGAADFPSGVGEVNGFTNIPVTGGDYKIAFNSITGAYNFELVVEYSTIGIIGMSGPFADWETDFAMTVDPTNPQLWFVPSIAVTTKDPAADDQGVKFRAENAWDINWGSDTWPDGIGTQGGPNIPTEEGTYGVSFNALTGEYLFGNPISDVEEIIDPASIKLYPNPASTLITLELETLDLEGEVSVSVRDLSGKTVLNYITEAQAIMQVDIASLQDGNYLLTIASDTHLLAKRFAIAK